MNERCGVYESFARYHNLIGKVHLAGSSTLNYCERGWCRSSLLPIADYILADGASFRRTNKLGQNGPLATCLKQIRHRIHTSNTNGFGFSCPWPEGGEQSADARSR